jgi:SAM-dependent methyltransferase
MSMPLAGHDGRTDDRCDYFLRLVSERWRRPRSIPSVLDLSRDTRGVAMFTRLGFHVTEIRLQHTSLQELSDRLDAMTGRFDVISCAGVLERVDDWGAIVRGIARRLRPGGVLCYSVTGRPTSARRFPLGLTRRLRGASRGTHEILDRDRFVPAGELRPVLQRAGLLPQELVRHGYGIGYSAAAAAVGDCAVSYMGYAFKRRERPAPIANGRWELRETAETWASLGVDSGEFETFAFGGAGQ